MSLEKHQAPEEFQETASSAASQDVESTTAELSEEELGKVAGGFTVPRE